MTRWKLLVEYDGRDLVGWQRQKTGMSVQEAIENAIVGFCGEQVRIQGAGRTDAGVHALGQVAHADIERETTADTVRDALNAHLRPLPIAILEASAAPPDFHARFSAIERVYRYRIINRRPPLTIEAGRGWHLQMALDEKAMNEAGKVLIGEHDFTSFRASLCQAKSPVKTISDLTVSREGEDIFIDVRAPSFLHHQVRNIAGTLKLVGEGKWSSDDVAAALAACDRARGGQTAPPDGLYLMSVSYPPGMTGDA